MKRWQRESLVASRHWFHLVRYYVVRRVASDPSSRGFCLEGGCLPYLVGISGLLLLWIMIGIASTFDLGRLIAGKDGRPSTSKFQLLVWSGTLVFSYLALYALQARSGNFNALASWPPNTLIALGISTVTAVSAKAITVNAITAGKCKPPLDGLGGILQDDDGTPDLGKIQMVVWTFIAIGVYLVGVFHNLHTGKPILPDIDRTLMVLMGIGHAAYLGKKLASS